MENSDKISLFTFAREMAEADDSYYRNSGADREELLAFMDGNSWFGNGFPEDYADPRIIVTDEAQEALRIWLQAYRKTDKEKVALLLAVLEDKYPETADRFRAYTETLDDKDAKSVWKALDFLLYRLEKELGEYSEEELHGLVADAYEEMKLKDLSVLTGCLSWNSNAAPYTDWKYKFKSHQIVKPDRSAYTVQDFAIMAYTVLNTESWVDNKLVEKALKSRRHANLWTFTALHFICALRATDIIRLPIPSLPYEKETVRRMIGDSTFPASAAGDIAFELQYRCRAGGMRPHKTKRKGISPEIKLFIPETLMEPIGFIMAISLSFRKEGDPFVDSDFTVRDQEHFFGSGFVQAAGHRSFGSRRANKAYIQGIEAIGGDIHGKPKGYMLASLARSHKGGIGRLAEITDIYLRDAAFTGTDPAFVIREMFERGIFGFIPGMLLDICYGEEYRKLGIKDQTDLISAIGLEAWQIEAVAGVVEASYRNAALIVRSTLDEVRGEDALKDALMRIASGDAASKQDECLCLRTATGLDCVRPGNTGCLGCGYEIYTKSALQLLVREYVRLNRKLVDESDVDRAKNLLKTYVIPSIVQIIRTVPELYPEADTEILRQIVERGMKDADAC